MSSGPVDRRNGARAENKNSEAEYQRMFRLQGDYSDDGIIAKVRAAGRRELTPDLLVSKIVLRNRGGRSFYEPDARELFKVKAPQGMPFPRRGHLIDVSRDRREFEGMDRDFYMKIQALERGDYDRIQAKMKLQNEEEDARQAAQSPDTPTKPLH